MKKIIALLLIATAFGCNMPKDNSGNVSLENEKDMAVYGKGLYGKYCVQCHGENGVPNSMLGYPNLTKTKLDNEDDIADLIFHGKNMMPAFKDKIEEAQLKAISIYVMTLKKK